MPKLSAALFVLMDAASEVSVSLLLVTAKSALVPPVPPI